MRVQCACCGDGCTGQYGGEFGPCAAGGHAGVTQQARRPTPPHSPVRPKFAASPPRRSESTVLVLLETCKRGGGGRLRGGRVSVVSAWDAEREFRAHAMNIHHHHIGNACRWPLKPSRFQTRRRPVANSASLGPDLIRPSPAVRHRKGCSRRLSQDLQNHRRLTRFFQQLG
jgi:hypothetical protein